MKKNDLYFERIIKRVLKEAPTGEPTGAPSTGPTGAPPATEEVKYYTYENKQNAGPFTVEELKNKKWNDDSYVWPEKDGTAWVQVKTIPELSTSLKGGSTPANKEATPSSSGDATMDTPPPGASKSFFDYCPTAKGARDSQTKNYANLQQSETDLAISRGGGLEEVNTIADKYFKAQGDFDKKTFLGSCMDELRLALKDKPEEVLKFQGPLNKWMAKDGKELGKKALTAGGNLLLNIANKALQAKGLGSLKMENTIKKNTKNNLMEIYNRKNRRR